MEVPMVNALFASGLARFAAVAVLLAVASGLSATGAAAVDAFSPCVRAKAWAQNPFDYNVRTAGVSASSRLANAIRLREACAGSEPVYRPRHHHHHWG
jgi:hypothetical protein